MNAGGQAREKKSENHQIAAGFLRHVAAPKHHVLRGKIIGCTLGLSRARGDGTLSPMTARVLIVDEQGKIAEPVVTALSRRFRVVRAASPDQVANARADVSLIGPGAADEAALCRQILESGVAEEVVILGNSPSLADTIRAIRAQAS